MAQCERFPSGIILSEAGFQAQQRISRGARRRCALDPSPRSPKRAGIGMTSTSHVREHSYRVKCEVFRNCQFCRGYLFTLPAIFG
jgi:hypothetical protein